MKSTLGGGEEGKSAGMSVRTEHYVRYLPSDTKHNIVSREDECVRERSRSHYVVKHLLLPFKFKPLNIYNAVAHLGQGPGQTS